MKEGVREMAPSSKTASYGNDKMGQATGLTFANHKEIARARWPCLEE